MWCRTAPNRVDGGVLCGRKLAACGKAAGPAIHKRQGRLGLGTLVTRPVWLRGPVSIGKPGGDALFAALGEAHDTRAARLHGPFARQHVLEDGSAERAAQMRSPFAPVETFAAQRTPVARQRVHVDPAGIKKRTRSIGDVHGVAPHVEKPTRGQAVEDFDSQIARQVIVTGAGSSQVPDRAAQRGYADGRRAPPAASGPRAPSPRLNQ